MQRKVIMTSRYKIGKFCSTIEIEGETATLIYVNWSLLLHFEFIKRELAAKHICYAKRNDYVALRSPFPTNFYRETGVFSWQKTKKFASFHHYPWIDLCLFGYSNRKPSVESHSAIKYFEAYVIFCIIATSYERHRMHLTFVANVRRRVSAVQ